MRVEKWYLDCVTANGAGMIGYAARLCWGPLALRVAESMLWQSDDSAALSQTVLGGSLPELSATDIVWPNPALAIQGRWQPLMPGIPPTVLHEEEAGRIEWTCHCPAAKVAVIVGGKECLGSGYAERIVITLPPDRLPVRELRWGRFIAGDHSCVWIRWQGPVARNWCFHNGRPVDAVMRDRLALSWNGHHLQLEQGATLRMGRIANTALKDSVLLRRMLPKTVLDLEETKWCSRGVLTDSDGREHSGWAIHEVAVIP